MKGLKIFQIFMKIARVLLIIMTALIVVRGIFFGLSLAVWITYDSISFANQSDFYKQVLAYTNIGSYYYNVSFFASNFILNIVSITLMIYAILYMNTEIRVGSLFDREAVRSIGWLGIRLIVFPAVAYAFSAIIFLYLNKGFPVKFIDFTFFIIGTILIVTSFILNYLMKLSHRYEDDYPAENKEYTEISE